MRLIGFLLLLVGIAGIGISGFMFGDIGLAGMIGSLSALLSGIGFMLAGGKLKKLSKEG